ncbi:LLM class flavin-dependent oxidoreductase [Ancylobacter sonchi]|nr:LLM class flavin-dependent oxidoreductase [Ancylobacter sonchi]
MASISASISFTSPIWTAAACRSSEHSSDAIRCCSSAIAVSIEHLGLVSTGSVLQAQLFEFTRRGLRLDHISDGCPAWNIVTLTQEKAGRSFGFERLVEYDERYEGAEEYAEVVSCGKARGTMTRSCATRPAGFSPTTRGSTRSAITASATGWRDRICRHRRGSARLSCFRPALRRPPRREPVHRDAEPARGGGADLEEMVGCLAERLATHPQAALASRRQYRRNGRDSNLSAPNKTVS